MTQQSDLPEVPADPHPAPRWLPDVLVTLVVVALAFVPSPVAEFLPTGPVTTALVLSPIVILPWRRRWPLGVLVVLLVLFGVTAVAGTLSPGIAIAIGVATFRIALHSSRRRAFLIGACATAAIMLLALLASIGSIVDPRVLQFGLIVAFGTAAGDGARSRRAYIAAITERAERAVQTREAEASRRVSEERLRIARDLHDTVAHQIAVISLNAGVASSAIDTRPDRAKESLQTIRSAARTVLGEIGDLLTMLRAEGPDGSHPSPQAGLGQLDELVAQFAASGLDVRTRIEGDLDRVTGAVDVVAYRVIQEALTNAHKHGAQHRAHVLIRTDGDEVVVTVTNPLSTGALDRPAEQGSGLGLIGLRERVASVRGAVSAGPAPAGFKVEARLPLTRDEAA
ncbi:sensor histidine kinase [Microbacterium trichothecenolyticum]|uniref:sensor histidine kinase n=1 Tax=Microbacterium trichothecenolyticum TaxID=69370 RepID=UPI001C6EAF78|nr:histidine kinase [Microbacterium trichothecenolyticum]MBW9120489.1 sensor histidine kinase [Microbacterium trichothecenolyticum]